AISTKDPVASIIIFFIAVLLEIAGTYMLFTAGSIAILKALKNNKKYYYKTNHFTAVSGMIYRMKQNAVGLANICILSTMVLIIVSSTSSLMIGMDNVIQTRYPNSFSVYLYETNQERPEKAISEIKTLQKENNINITKEIEYDYLSFSAFQDNNNFIVKKSNASDMLDLNKITALYCIPLSDYNKMSSTDIKLNKDEIILYSLRTDFNYSTLKLFNKEYKIKEKPSTFFINGESSAYFGSSIFIVLPDTNELTSIYNNQKAVYGDNASVLSTYYGFDTNADENTQIEFESTLKKAAKEYSASIECRAGAKSDFMGLYGGLFFIGIFLGLLFTMATVLIIYYKQISEGYDDKERFQIMQKVGMSHDEVKASIRSQVLTVFFMPLIVAGIHTAAAFPLVSKLLALLNLSNTWLFIAATAICFIVFAAVYICIYMITAKTYYKIVRR
ncbi:MAG: ABC transporter permease, partial [Clostridiales bacterium]|nr:ABC transporter permease [Clostridiales bacterium]